MHLIKQMDSNDDGQDNLYQFLGPRLDDICINTHILVVYLWVLYIVICEYFKFLVSYDQ